MHLVFRGGSVRLNSTLRLKSLAKSNFHPRMWLASFPGRLHGPFVAGDHGVHLAAGAVYDAPYSSEGGRSAWHPCRIRISRGRIWWRCRSSWSFCGGSWSSVSVIGCGVAGKLRERRKAGQ